MAKQPSCAHSLRRTWGQSSGSRVGAGGSSRVRALRPPPPDYDRRTAIAKVLALWPHELEDESPSARLEIIAKLRRVLRAERQRGLAGHWTYDLARHVQLLQVYRQELKAVTRQPNAGAQAGSAGAVLAVGLGQGIRYRGN